MRYVIVITGLLTFVAFKKQRETIVAAPNFCKILDTLISERYYWKSSDYKYLEKYLPVLEKKSKIYGSYMLGFAGITKYYDTLFNNDMRKWAAFFSCKPVIPPAKKENIAYGDTARLRFD